MSVRKGRLYGCPVELALDVLGGKWKTVILARLKERPMRYGEVRRAIPNLPDKVLTQRLRELEEAGLIERADLGGMNGYRVTRLGRSLQPALTALFAWGETHGSKVGVRYRTPVGR